MTSQTISTARESLVQHVRTAVLLTIVLTVLLGIVYPLVMTGISQVLFPAQANGSLIRDSSGTVIGSAILAQNFTQPEYFHPRPSAAGSDGNSSPGTPCSVKRRAEPTARITACVPVTCSAT